MPNNFITVAYMNIWAQTGLDLAKQVQIERFISSYKIDILHCQEINIDQNSFSSCDLITSSYKLITNNAQNGYGTFIFVSNSLKFKISSLTQMVV